jgi:hypothetical protein
MALENPETKYENFFIRAKENIEKQLTPEQIQDAQKRAAEWAANFQKMKTATAN